eukprot:7100453-Prymnesium_polylepis.1
MVARAAAPHLERHRHHDVQPVGRQRLQVDLEALRADRLVLALAGDRLGEDWPAQRDTHLSVQHRDADGHQVGAIRRPLGEIDRETARARRRRHVLRVGGPGGVFRAATAQFGGPRTGERGARHPRPAGCRCPVRGGKGAVAGAPSEKANAASATECT